MRSLISRLKGLTELLVLTVLLMIGWGGSHAMAQWFTSPGGGSGGFTGRPLITVELYVDGDQTSASVPVNLAGVGPNPSLPYTRTLTAVVRQDGRLFPTNIQLDLAPTLASGALFDPEDLTQGFRSLPLENTSGIATAFFHASSTPGEVIITASAQDPSTSQVVSASIRITVVDEKRPPAAITFTGPYVNAVLAGVSRFGEPLIQSGSYSRVISVVINDLNGNPTNPNTQVNFYLIDGPITGYPNNPGSFFVAGPNSDPFEGQLWLSALNPSGNFVTKGVRPYDRLVLDGRQTEQNPLPNNFFQTGVWSVQSVVGETALTIVPPPQGKPFNTGDNNGFTVPYVVGRAQNAAVLSPSFTDLDGVASTTLTYPVERIGQTAIVVACVANTNVCGILNTCDRNGANCQSVYLGVTNGSDRTLTVSATSLGPNRSTDVLMCLRDANFTPLPATEIRYSIGSTGPATVTIDGVEGNQGAVLTGGDGCALVDITSSGQPLGGLPIEIDFTSDYVAAPVKVTIKSPGSGKMDGLFNCEFAFDLGTAVCEGVLRLTDDELTPIEGELIAVGNITAAGAFTLTFDPAEGVFGKTNEEGLVNVTVELGAPGEYEFPFQTAADGSASYTLTVTVPAPGTLTITATGLDAGRVGQPYSALLQADGGVPPYAFSLLSGALPPGLGLSATGAISGTPTREGSFSFSVRVQDSQGLLGFAAFTIVIGQQPALTLALTPTTGAVGVPYNGIVSATGGTAPYAFQRVAGSLPDGLTLNLNGTLSGTPTRVGAFAVSIEGTDSKGAVGTLNTTITITSTSPVTVTFSPPTATVGQFFSAVLTASGGTPPYTFVRTAGDLPPGVTLNTNGTLSGVPTVPGAFVATFQATDQLGIVGSITSTITVSSTPLEGIDATQFPLTGTLGVPYNGVLRATFGTAPYTWTLVATSPPGTIPPGLTSSTAGDSWLLLGTPLTSGLYSFTLQVVDSGDPDPDGDPLTDDAVPPQTVIYPVTMAITGGGTLQVATASPLPNATENAAYTANLTAACSGICGTAFTWSVVAGGGDLPPGMTLGPCVNISSLSCPLTGTVPAGTLTANRTYTFVVKLTDNLAPNPNEVLKTFQLTVINTNP